MSDPPSQHQSLAVPVRLLLCVMADAATRVRGIKLLGERELALLPPLSSLISAKMGLGSFSDVFATQDSSALIPYLVYGLPLAILLYSLFGPGNVRNPISYWSVIRAGVY